MRYETREASWRKVITGQFLFEARRPVTTGSLLLDLQTLLNTNITRHTFGIRMRHQVFDQWLNENRKIDHVLANLKQANFDPEFYSRYEKDIFKSFKENLKKF